MVAARYASGAMKLLKKCEKEAAQFGRVLIWFLLMMKHNYTKCTSE